jgi:uncharacterized protein
VLLVLRATVPTQGYPCRVLWILQRLINKAREQTDKGLAGSMEGHAAMDMSIATEGSFWTRLSSPQGFTAVAHVFVMEWAVILRDLVIGLLLAGAIGAWVPNRGGVPCFH